MKVFPIVERYADRLVKTLDTEKMDQAVDVKKYKNKFINKHTQCYILLNTAFTWIHVLYPFENMSLVIVNVGIYV